MHISLTNILVSLKTTQEGALSASTILPVASRERLSPGQLPIGTGQTL